MVQDPELAKAVAGIPQRSEKQSDLQKLVGSFVDVGILPQIDNINSQIVYGRRGTGKTHVLRVLASSISARMNRLAVYVDARTLGSSSQFSDPTVSLPTRCTALFRDLLNEIYNGLLEFVVNVAPEGADAALVELDALAAAGVESPLVPTSMTDRQTQKETGESGAGFGLTTKGVEIKVQASGGISSEAERATRYVREASAKIVFPSISTPLRRILEGCKSHLYVLIDEWSSVPLDVQPYLAEFLKRSILPLSAVTIKIASLEYRSDFSITTDNSVIGFEMGADISASLDIDDTKCMIATLMPSPTPLGTCL